MGVEWDGGGVGEEEKGGRGGVEEVEGRVRGGSLPGLFRYRLSSPERGSRV